MRYTCCSSLRQGSLFQATLCSSLTWAAGAFLSSIRVTFYPPYSRAYVSISWALPQALATSAIFPWMTLVGTDALYRPPTRVHSGLPRSDLMSSVALGRALSTVRRARREKGVPEAPFQRALEAQRLVQVPFWSSWSA